MPLPRLRRGRVPAPGSPVPGAARHSAEIEATIAAYAARYHALDGGGIFYVELENDAPFANARALIESIARFR